MINRTICPGLDLSASDLRAALVDPARSRTQSARRPRVSSCASGFRFRCVSQAAPCVAVLRRFVDALQIRSSGKLMRRPQNCFGYHCPHLVAPHRAGINPASYHQPSPWQKPRGWKPGHIISPLNRRGGNPERLPEASRDSAATAERHGREEQLLPALHDLAAGV